MSSSFGAQIPGAMLVFGEYNSCYGLVENGKNGKMMMSRQVLLVPP